MITLPAIKPKSRVGILGGSFDPPHLGHQLLGVCALALESVDQLWVMPCADHPFSKKLSPFDHRMTMVKLAFGMFDTRVQVIDLEKQLAGPSYSVKTLEAIRKITPHLDVSLIMGSDVYLDLARWKNPEKLAELCSISVFLREGSPLSGLSSVGVPAKIHDQFVLPHIKSTTIRKMIGDQRKDLPFVDQSVMDYIHKNELYRDC